MDPFKFPANKDRLKIIVTDSGLGGLSVQALLDKELRERKFNLSFDVIFFNALADRNYGYNVMSKKSEKLYVFEKAISGMLKLDPDIILIACNTLSVLFPLTEISNKINIPVISIVNVGVDMVLRNIKESNTSGIIIFGTETTIASKIYEKALIEKGVDASRIVTQKCKNLESEIQLNPLSNSVNKLIEKFVGQAAEKVKLNFVHLFILLACTHYGYSKSVFREKLNSKFGSSITILNPNEQMAKFFTIEKPNKKQLPNRIYHKVYSKVRVRKSEEEHLLPLLAQDSSALANSLKYYSFSKDLFTIDIKPKVKN